MMCRSNNNRAGRRGFTIIELLVAIAMTTIMASMVITNLKKFSINFQMTTASKELLHNLTVAQAEAINSDAHVVIDLDTTNNRYRFFRSIMVPDGSGNLIKGPYEVFNRLTGDVVSPTDKSAWVYLTPGKYESGGQDTIAFGNLDIPSGSAGSVSGRLICFNPRTGTVNFCTGAGGALRGSIVLIPGKEYYEPRFGETPSASGRMKRGGVTRKIVVSFNGDFSECRWVDKNGKWDMDACN